MRGMVVPCGLLVDLGASVGLPTIFAGPAFGVGAPSDVEGSISLSAVDTISAVIVHGRDVGVVVGRHIEQMAHTEILSLAHEVFSDSVIVINFNLNGVIQAVVWGRRKWN